MGRGPLAEDFHDVLAVVMILMQELLRMQAFSLLRGQTTILESCVLGVIVAFDELRASPLDASPEHQTVRRRVRPRAKLIHFEIPALGCLRLELVLFEVDSFVSMGRF